MVRGSALLGTFVALSLCAGPVGAQDVGLPLGTVPDGVVLEDLAGDSLDLGALIGTKPVLLEFWATWCPLCEALEPQLEAVTREFGDRVAVVVVAVGVNQTPRSIRRHIDRHPLPGRLVWDRQGRAARAFAAPTTSYVVLLDQAGRVAYTGVGEDQDLVAAVHRVLR